MMTSFLLIPFCMILCRIDFPQMKIRMRKMYSLVKTQGISKSDFYDFLDKLGI